MEAEQAAVLYRLLSIYAERGADWHGFAAEGLDAIIARIKAKGAGSIATQAALPTAGEE